MLTGVQLHVGQDAGDLQGVGQVGLSGEAHLAVVDPGRVDIGPVDDVQIRLRVGIRMILVE